MQDPDRYNKYSKQVIEEVTEGLNELKETLGDDKFEILMSKNTDALKAELLEREDIPSSIKNNIDAYIENKDAIDKHAQSVRTAAEENEYYMKQMMESMISNKYGDRIKSIAGENEGRRAQITSIVAGQQKDAQEKMLKEMEQNALTSRDVEYNRDLNKYREAGAKTFNDEELAKEYARLVLGRKDADDLVYVGGNDKGGLKTRDGEIVLAEEHTDDTKRQELARYYLNKQTEDKYKNQVNGEKALNNIESILGKASKAGDQYGADFSDALLNAATSKDHQIDLSEAFVDIDPDEIKLLRDQSDDDILKMFNLSNEELKLLGFDSSEQFIESFKEGLENYS